ncbi:MAG: phosphoglycerate kinase [Pseudomonadota bacterium]
MGAAELEPISMPAFKTIDDLDVDGKRVFVRVDFNVPMQDGRITDVTRIERALPTITFLADRGAKVVLLSHYGRPKGERVPDMSLRPVAEKLAEVLGAPVGFADDCIGDHAHSAISDMKAGSVLVLENTRFHPGEEKNDQDFATALAANADVYVNDAFSAAHRAHASTEGIAHLLPSAAGKAMERELTYLAAALGEPKRPLACLVGGAKVSTKIELLLNLVGKADALIVGGGMANTFLFAQGISVGKSLCEPDLADTAKEILNQAQTRGCEIVLPSDVVVAKEFKAGAAREVIDATQTPPDGMILDVGPASVDRIAATIERAQTLVWNGPLGAFEIDPFDTATVEAARFAASRVKAGALTAVAGGGDTVAALNHAGVAEDFTYVSTAGGAFLEWLEGKTLPGVDALKH